MILPTKKYAGYIYDLDGTLVESMGMHYRAWRAALAEHGAPHVVFLQEEFFELGGVAAQDIVLVLNKKYGLAMCPDGVAETKRKLYLDLMDTVTIPQIEVVVEFVRALPPGTPKAIGTGSVMPGAIATLRAGGLEGLFDIIITPEQVQRGKPHPDIFLLAAEKMGVPATECVVFEDAPAGIQAAVAAGMEYVEVRQIHNLE